MPLSHRALMSAGTPSMRYSLGMPTRLPLRSLDNPASQLGSGRSSEVESFGSNPAMASSRMAQSRTDLAIGPAWSSELAKETMPQREQRPYVGLMPQMPVKAAGWRMEPPVSVPVAAGAMPAATAAADPPDDPPGVIAALLPSLRLHGETTGP